MKRPDGLSLASRFLLLLTLIWAGVTLWLAWRLQWSGPFRDLWEVMPLIEKTFAGEWHWPDFWAAYGGAHRLVIPRFLFAVEYRFFGGENRFILLVSLGCQLLTAALLWLRLRQTWPQQPTLQTLGAACILLTLFCGTQLFNFNYSYDTQWFQAILFSVIALLLATSPTLANTPKRHLSGMMLAALLASLSNMAGLLVWPVLALTVFASRIHLSWKLGFTLLAVFMPIFFMMGVPGHPSDATDYQPTHLEILLWLASVLAQMLKFVGLYLGSPLTRDWPVAGSLLIALLMLWVLRDGWRALTSSDRDRPLRLLCAGLVMQVFLIGLATAWGRIFYPVTMALAERYQTAILMAWLAVALAGLAWLQRHGWRRTAWLLPLLLAAGLAHHHYRGLINGIHLSQSVNNAHLAAAMGITDMSIARQSLSFPAINNHHNYLAWHNDFLRQHHLAYFRRPSLEWLGGILPDTAIRGDCRLDIHHMKDVAGHDDALEVNGQLECTGKSPAVIALLNEQNRVIGLALTLGPWLQSDRWLGYTRGEFDTLHAVAFGTDSSESP